MMGRLSPLPVKNMYIPAYQRMTQCKQGMNASQTENATRKAIEAKRKRQQSKVNNNKIPQYTCNTHVP